MRSTRSLLALFLVLIASEGGCASSGGRVRHASPGGARSNTRDVFHYQGVDNKDAARLLATFLGEHGVRVVKVQEGAVFATSQSMAVVFRPAMTRGLDRIVVYTGLPVKAAFRGSDRLRQALATLNDKYNIGSFSTDNGGTVFLVVGYVTFADTLEWVELKAFLEWFLPSVYQAIFSEAGDLVG